MTPQKIIRAYAEGKITDEKSLEFYLLLEELKRLNMAKAIEEKINELLGEIKTIQGHTPTDEELLALITPLIPDVRDGRDGKTGAPGHTPTQTELLALIRPLIPKLPEIKVPTAEEIALKVKVPDENKIVDRIEDDLPKLGEPIRDGLEMLEGDDRLDKTAIKGLEDYDQVATLAKQSTKYLGFGGGGGSVKVSDLETIDLSSQCNGVLQTFSLGRSVNKVLLVLGDSGPLTYTSTTTSITLTIATPESGEKLLALVV